MRLIENEQDIKEGVEALCAAHPLFKQALDVAGSVPLRRRAGGFAALAQVIVGQQVSVASAQAIWRRLEAAGMGAVQGVAEACDESFKIAGVSRQKMRYLRALAAAGIEYDALPHMTDEKICDTLTAVSGIGQWSADIYLMFSLGRPDVFANGDLALQEATRLLLGLPERPNARQMGVIAANWSPWRAVAARLLWAYYGAIKQRQGVL